MTVPQDPWADQTAEVAPQDNPFRRGVAPVGPRRPTAHRPAGHPPTAYPPTAYPPTVQQPTVQQPPVAAHEPTGTGWPGGPQPARIPGEELRQLRRGLELSVLGALFAFVCWGLWAISSGGDLRSPVAIFVLTMLVAVGLFFLARLLGKVVWERQLGRVRRSAKGAHAVVGLFLGAVGVAYLRQVGWIVTAWNWVAGQF
jgi:hypothetical protein